MVLMLEERCNVLKLLNRKKRGQKTLNGVGIKSLPCVSCETVCGVAPVLSVEKV